MSASPGRLREAPITIITHDDPIGRGPSNYIVHANLDEAGSQEQLWTRQLSADAFEIACLPFFTYGICHRDVVTVDAQHMVSTVVTKSGHRTLRIALVRDHPQLDQLHELLHGRIVALGLAHEWLQGTYLAIDLPLGTDSGPLTETLKGPRAQGALFWEIDS